MTVQSFKDFFVSLYCNSFFTDIDCTLQHFQFVQVTVNENFVKSECKDSKNSTNTDMDTDSIRVKSDDAEPSLTSKQK